MQKRGQTLEEFCPEGSLAGVLVSTVVKYPHTIDHWCLITKAVSQISVVLPASRMTPKKKSESLRQDAPFAPAALADIKQPSCRFFIWHPRPPPSRTSGKIAKSSME
jgi:hypothetical protein